jgi:hypothetical protein
MTPTLTIVRNGCRYPGTLKCVCGSEELAIWTPELGTRNSVLAVRNMLRADARWEDGRARSLRIAPRSIRGRAARQGRQGASSPRRASLGGREDRRSGVPGRTSSGERLALQQRP